MINNLLFFILLFCFNLLIVYNYNFIAQKINIYDVAIEKRKIHKGSIPVLGGLIIYSNIVFFYIYGIIVDFNLILYFLILTEIKGLFFFSVIFTLIFLIGLYDDKFNIRPLIRLMSLSILIYCMIVIDQRLIINSLDFSFSNLSINFNLGAIMFSYLCFLTLLIACNMSDGLNLQSFIFYILNFSFLFYINSNVFIITIIIALLFFALLNFKGKVFLGDSGSYLLSIILSFYFIKYYSFDYGLKSDQIFLFLFFPVLDASRCFASRLITGKNIFFPDNIHFHHLLFHKIGYFKTIVIIGSFYLFPFITYFLKISTYITFGLIVFFYLFFLIKFKS